MSVSIESNNTCTARVEKVTEIDNEICTNTPDSDPGRVGIEDNGEEPSTVDPSEGEAVLGETIFCRQVDMLTYVDYSEQESTTGLSMPEVVDDAGLNDSDQIRTLSLPSEDLPSHQQPVWVSTGASGKIGESPDEEQLAMPKTKGVYILGYVEGVGCPICVDIGCTKTTISERLYYRIPRE